METSIVLTRDELVALTSTKQPKRMAVWLTKNAWVFEPARNNRDYPKVDRGYYQARMFGQVSTPQKRVGPDLGFLLNKGGNR